MSHFDDFWSAYPRKQGKLAAEKAYAKAFKLATPEEILAGVELAARQWRLERVAQRYIPMPATWLNQGRWMDEHEVAARPAALGPQYTAWECPHIERHWNRGDCQVATNLGRPERGEAAS